MKSFRAIIVSLCLLSQFCDGFDQYGSWSWPNNQGGTHNGGSYGSGTESSVNRPVDKYSRISCKHNVKNYDCVFKNVHIDEHEAVSITSFGDYGKPHVSGYKSLAFDDSTIRRLSREWLYTYPYTTLLNLQDVQLRTIDRDAFSNGRQLQQLYLSYNGLEELPQGVFDYLRGLEAVQLNSNRLKRLPAGLFFYNPSLVSVTITNNALTRIENSTFTNNPQLQHVNVSSNSIEHFDLSLLTEAFEIDVSHNRLTEVKIPSKLGKLVASNNHIARIVPNGENKDLKELDLSNNKLTTISWASLYPSLEELDLGHNEIEDVTSEHLPTRKLKKLLLNNNRLFSFDLTKSIPKHLRVLDLSHNQLTFIEKSVKLLSSQYQLYLHNNAIVSLNLTANNTLQNVSLSNNDWDCANLRKQLAVIESSAILDYDVPSCKEGYTMESRLCCKEAAMPYHDRLLEQIRSNSVFEIAKRIQCDNEPQAIVDIDLLNESLQSVSSASPEVLEGEVANLEYSVGLLSTEKTSGQQELYAVRQMLSDKLPRYGGFHEGFDTARMLADKLISRLEDRKRLRERVTKEGREEAEQKERERDELKRFIDSLETTLKRKKADIAKMKQDTSINRSDINKLQSQINKNARSSHKYNV